MKLLLSLLFALTSLSQAATVLDAKIWFSSADGDDMTGPYPILGVNVGAYNPSAVDGLILREPGFLGWGGGSITIDLAGLETVTSVTMTAVRVNYPFTPYVQPPVQHTVSLYSGHASDTGPGSVLFDFSKTAPGGDRNLWIWWFGQQGVVWDTPFTLSFSYKIETSAGTFLHDNGGNGWTLYSAVPEPSIMACASFASLLATGRRRRPR